MAPTVLFLEKQSYGFFPTLTFHLILLPPLKKTPIIGECYFQRPQGIFSFKGFFQNTLHPL